MEKENFIKWFIRKGWKSYTIPVIIFMVITLALIFSDGGIEEMIKYNDVPLLVWVGACIAYFGFMCGIIWHIITSFKKQRK